MSEERVQKKMQPQSLRVVSPKLYRFIVGELDKVHIHSYDLQMDAIKEEKGIQLIVRFGEQFNHTDEKFFSYEAVGNVSDELVEFIQSTAEACKDVMINEYYKMMKP